MNKYIVCVFLFFISFLYSCNNDNQDVKNLEEAEFYVDNKLASVSLDELGNIWVGSRVGNVYLFKDCELFDYPLYGDVIYKAALHVGQKQDTLLWVASRNAGLQVWNIKKRNFPQKIKTYTVQIKDEKYSPYDFTFDEKGNAYVATSMGFYKIDEQKEEQQLELISPSIESLSKYRGYVFPVRNLSRLQNQIIGSTTEGLILYNIDTEETSRLLAGKNIEHVSVYNDTIFATTKNGLYKILPENKDVIFVTAPNHPMAFYKDDKQNNFLIALSNISITKDYKTFENIKSRRLIPANGRNLIVNDTLKAFSYLVTEDALWRIPTNLNLFHGRVDVKASCVNGDDIYYITAKNELFLKKKNENKADWLYTLDENDPIIWMDILDNDIYMYSSTNIIYKMRVYSHWIKNIVNSPKKIYQTKEKITATFLDKHPGDFRLYIGTQEGLLCMENGDSIRCVPAFDGKYITAFFEQENAGRIYISTLNEGVFYAGVDHVNYKSIPSTVGVSFIKDIAATNEHISNLIILDNKKIISEDPQSVLNTNGLEKLIFVNDTSFFAIAQRGIFKYIISDGKIQPKGSFFNDISFNPKASYLGQGCLVLNSNLGSMTVSVDDMANPDWIAFGDTVDLDKLSIVFLILLVFLIMLIYVLRMYYTKKSDINEAQIQKQHEDLLRRVADAQSFIGLSDGNGKLKIELDGVYKYLEDVDIEGSDKRKVKDSLDAISLQIANVNRKISLHLPVKLNELKIELRELETDEAKLLITKIQDVQDSDDVSRIKEVITEAQTWLNERMELIGNVKKYLVELEDNFEIDGLNSDLHKELCALFEKIEADNLVVCKKNYTTIKKKIDKVNNREAKDAISIEIRYMKKLLEREIEKDNSLYSLSLSLDNIAELLYEKDVKNTSVLKAMKNIGDQISMLNILDKIKDEASVFRKMVDTVLDENSQRIIKKIGKDLDKEIQSATSRMSADINKLIDHFIEIIPHKDAVIMSDVLKINNPNSQNARVLVLLMADKGMKRTIIPSILGIYGSLNPVISRLINDRIKVNVGELKEKLAADPVSVLLIRILALLD